MQRHPQGGKAKDHFDCRPHPTMRIRDKLISKLTLHIKGIPELGYSLDLAAGNIKR